MANLLYLVHRLPYPPNKGDKVRTYRTLYQAEVPGGAEHTPAGYRRWAEYGKSLKGEFTVAIAPADFVL